MANVALVTFGSAGDVHPMLALGQALRARGHRVALLTNPWFEADATRCGLEFMPVGSLADREATIAHPKLWHPVDGLGVMWRYLLRPALVPTYETLAALAQEGRWVVVASPMAMGARIAQEHLGLHLVSAYTAPMMLRTVHDPLVLGPWKVPRMWPHALRRLAWRTLDRVKLEPLVRPALDALRGRLGLPAIGTPVFDRWMHSPQAGLALFPPWFAPSHPDWPPQVEPGGFPLFDGDQHEALSPELERFLGDGPAPVVIAPGTATVQSHGLFDSAVNACAQLGVRALFVGADAPSMQRALPDGVHAAAYVPFGSLLPRARALLHCGGVGSCAQAMRAGIPQLITPRSYDQFDNAMRVQRLGVGLSLKDGNGIAAALGRLLQDETIAAACRHRRPQVTPREAREAIVRLVERLA